jgi:hypothetical protein
MARPLTEIRIVSSRDDFLGELLLTMMADRSQRNPFFIVQHTGRGVER